MIVTLSIEVVCMRTHFQDRTKSSEDLWRDNSMDTKHKFALFARMKSQLEASSNHEHGLAWNPIWHVTSSKDSILYQDRVTFVATLQLIKSASSPFPLPWNIALARVLLEVPRGNMAMLEGWNQANPCFLHNFHFYKYDIFVILYICGCVYYVYIYVYSFFCQSRFSSRLTAVGPTLLFEWLWRGKIRRKENQSTQSWNLKTAICTKFY
jgi:hypothetical protein